MSTEVVQTPVMQLDAKLSRYDEISREIARLKIEQGLIKQSATALVKEHHLSGHRIPLPNTQQDIKITVDTKPKRALDVDQLATDLGISVTEAKKKETLMRAVSEGRLTMAAYEGYFFYEEVEKTNIRRVKA